MEEVADELARNKAELHRRRKQARKERARKRKQRENALLTATIAFSHDPTAGPTIANAIQRKYKDVRIDTVDALQREIENRFLETPIDTLAQWLDWSAIPRKIRNEAQRVAVDARVLHWIDSQSSAQGIAPPPQFVWEKRCALVIDQSTSDQRHADAMRPTRSAAAKKWMQRFRQRWNLCLSRLPAKDLLPKATMQAKVRAATCFLFDKVVHRWDHFGVHSADPKMGPCVCFGDKRRLKKRNPFWTIFWHPRQQPCGSGTISCRDRSHMVAQSCD